MNVDNKVNTNLFRDFPRTIGMPDSNANMVACNEKPIRNITLPLELQIRVMYM